MLSLSLTFSTRYDNALFLLQSKIARDDAMASKDPVKLVEAAQNSVAAAMNSGKAFSSYTFAFLDGAVVVGGNGNNYIETFSFAAVAEQDGNDEINVHNYSAVSGGNGDDTISAYHFALVTGGAGNDTVETYDFATVDGGDGHDIIRTYSYSTVSGGKGNDQISGYDYLTADGGEGDDTIFAYSYGNLSGGDGDDSIDGNDHLTADGGNGNDRIVAGSYAQISGGAGDDMVTVAGRSHVDGGDGNDILVAVDRGGDGTVFGNTTLDGGSGDDYLQGGLNARLIGGAGNDIIRVVGEGATVVYGRGDGSDTVRATSDFTLDISGYRQDDVTIASVGDTYVLSFAGSAETITIDLTSGVTARLKFDGGGTLDVTGADVRKQMAHLLANYDGTSGHEAINTYYEQDMWKRGIRVYGTPL